MPVGKCAQHSAGDEIARKIAEVAKEVYVTARTYTNPNRPEPRSNIYHLSWLKSLNPDGSASFMGGESLHADSIIYATGYKYTYPFLHQTGLLTTGRLLSTLASPYCACLYLNACSKDLPACLPACP